MDEIDIANEEAGMDELYESKLRRIRLEVVIDWEDSDDVCDELILEDSGIYENLKDGVDIQIIKDL